MIDRLLTDSARVFRFSEDQGAELQKSWTEIDGHDGRLVKVRSKLLQTDDGERTVQVGTWIAPTGADLQAGDAVLVKGQAFRVAGIDPKEHTYGRSHHVEASLVELRDVGQLPT